MSKWNHNICDECWSKDNPNRTPMRISAVFDESEVEDYCCLCGEKNVSGIYRREDPTKMLCQGNHVHEEAI